MGIDDAGIYQILFGMVRLVVTLTGATWSSNRRVVLHFAVHRERGGPVVGLWTVRAAGIREFSLSDVAGGGLGLSSGKHPVLRQYNDARARLRLTGLVPDVSATMGELWQAHVALVDDWIPPERYLGAPDQLRARLTKRLGLMCRGPAFLMRCYAHVLTKQGVATSVTPVPRRRLGHAAPRLLHFGTSFVVAESLTSGRAG